MPIMIITSPKNILLDELAEKVIIKSLRLILLVGDDEDTFIATQILSVLSQEKQGV